jgi:hypothetical protein
LASGFGANLEALIMNCKSITDIPKFRSITSKKMPSLNKAIYFSNKSATRFG